MPFSYANPLSGPSAGSIGWFNFENLSISPGQTVTGLTGTLNDGTTVTFDLSCANISGGPRTFDASPVPTYPGAEFGNSGYTGISGNASLWSVFSAVPGANLLTLSNIVVLDGLGNPVLNYTAIVADAETTGAAESWNWQTNGGAWALLAQLGNQTSPVLSGLGTQTATLTGNGSSPSNSDAAYVLTTLNPTQLLLSTATTSALLGREAVSIGFATTRVRLQKNVGGRIDPTDQFALSIAGTPSSQATTTGTANGIQSAEADIFAIPGNAYAINESIAPGSASALSDYTIVVSASNSSIGGSVPPTSALPITFTPALGDNVLYTILNAAPEIFDKSVDKDFVTTGDILTYTVTVENPNNFALNNVLVTDNTPSGTTYIGNLSVSVPYTGTDPASGITITTIAANSSVTLSWQVQVNSLPPVLDPIANVAMVTVPGGTSGNTNVTVTKVNRAFLAVNKAVDKAFADTGDTLTYTLTLNNVGNVPANNVVITDAVPAGATFVPGSVTGATGTPPTLTLTSPIAPGATATVSYQVKIGSVIPNPNPIPNSASASYVYTVDPADPNGTSATNNSNTVTTAVNSAIVSTVKAVNKTYATVGDVLTYTLTLQNTGSVPADNVVITDAVPSGTTFVSGSLTGATGAPPTLTLTAPIAPGDSAVVTYQVLIGAAVPNPNPVPNTAAVAFTYTINPADPDGTTGSSESNTVTTQINAAIVSSVKTVDKAYVGTGDVITYTIVLKNTGNTTANNVILTDAIAPGTTFVAGSLTGATGTPPILTLNAPIPAGGAATVTYQVLVDNTVPTPNPVTNTTTGDFTFTADPANPNGATGTTTSNTTETLVSSAVVSSTKLVDKAYANLGDTLTYTLLLQNSGNVAANNVVITDAVPAGTTFVPGSLSGATGTPPTLTLTAPIPAGGTATVTYQIKVGLNIPNPNPVPNTATTVYTYTVNPAVPNSATNSTISNLVTTLVSAAKLSVTKTVDKIISYLGDTVTYHLTVINSGSTAADNVVITDPIPNGTTYFPGSLTVSVPYSGMPAAGIALTNPIAPDEAVSISFQIKATVIPNPNPIINKATANYAYTVDPGQPDSVAASVMSNPVTTVVFRYNFSQEINDLIESVALEQAALAAVINAEGAKIQKMAAMNNITPQELLCLNKSVSDMMDSLSTLEAILKQKLGVAECQINGLCL